MMISNEEKAEIVNTIRNWSSLGQKEKTSKKYTWVSKFELLQMGTAEPILYRKALNQEFVNAEGHINLEMIKQEATYEALFDILLSTHVSIGHGKCNCKGNCSHGKCKCKKQGVLCGSRCHKALQCSNK
jgi:hypothetical protein